MTQFSLNLPLMVLHRTTADGGFATVAERPIAADQTSFAFDWLAAD